MRSRSPWISCCLRPRAVSALLVLLVGCGPGAPQAADPEAAQTALRTALDAWQHGDPPDALSRAQPPIYVSDWRWQSGAKLVRYEIENRNRALGAELRCYVQLWIDKGTGKTVRESAQYNIGTHPALTVARAGDR
jgi:hypothetical protein